MNPVNMYVLPSQYVSHAHLHVECPLLVCS